MADESVKVLYVAGAGRSGGTILSHVLGQQDGWFYAGELRDLWTSGLRQEKMCGCGRRVVECEVWKEIFDQAFGGLDNVDTKQMAKLRGGLSRTRNLPAALRAKFGRTTDSHQKVYRDRLAQLYQAIRKVTGCRVIVDASRLVPYGLYVSSLPNIDLRVAHLVRDPRAVAFSWQRRRFARTASFQIELQTQNALRSSLDWVAQNLIGRVVWPHVAEATMTLRYEDAIADPNKALGKVAGLVAEGLSQLVIQSDHIVTLKSNHSVAGNAYRSQVGSVELKLDDEWRHALRSRDRIVTTLLCWPGILYYGYPIFPGL